MSSIEQLVPQTDRAPEPGLAVFEAKAPQVHAELVEWLQAHNISPQDVLVAGYSSTEASEKGNPEFATGRQDEAGNAIERVFLGSVQDLLHTDEEGRNANPLYFALGRPLMDEPARSGVLGAYLRALLEQDIVEAEDPSEPEFGTILLETSIPKLKDALLVERNIDI